MKEIDVLFPKVTDSDQIQGAVDLVNFHYKRGLMLPTTYEKYQSLSEKGHLLVATNSQSDVVGTVAYTLQYANDIWELGGLAVAEGWMHKGIATVIVQELIKNIPHHKTLVVANKNSEPLFLKLGATKIEYPNNLPLEIYIPCADCPVKPEQGCCDTLMSLAPIVLNILSQADNVNQDVISDVSAEEWGL